MKPSLTTSLAFLVGAFVVPTTTLAFGESDGIGAITSAVEQFHNALAAGNSDKVISLLLPDALIVEAGEVQTRTEYQRQHLAEDIAFAHAVSFTTRNVVVRKEGNVAWVTSTFRLTGNFQGRSLGSLTAETVVLSHTSAGWRISTIHWSSHKQPQT